MSIWEMMMAFKWASICIIAIAFLSLFSYNFFTKKFSFDSLQSWKVAKTKFSSKIEELNEQIDEVQNLLLSYRTILPQINRWNRLQVSYAVYNAAMAHPLEYVAKYFFGNTADPTIIDGLVKIAQNIDEAKERWQEMRTTASQLEAAMAKYQPAFLYWMYKNDSHIYHSLFYRSVLERAEDIRRMNLVLGKTYVGNDAGTVSTDSMMPVFVFEYLTPVKQESSQVVVCGNALVFFSLAKILNSKCPKKRKYQPPASGELPQIYAYRDKIPGHEDLLKVGYTAKDIDERVAAQFPIMGPYEDEKPYEIMVRAIAVDSRGVPFKDFEVHQMLENMGVERLRGEWFRTDATTVMMAIERVKNHISADEEIVGRGEDSDGLA